MVAVVLDNLAAGVPTDELLKSYPDSVGRRRQAALEYAAACPRADRLLAKRCGSSVGLGLALTITLKPVLSSLVCERMKTHRVIPGVSHGGVKDIPRAARRSRDG